MSETIVYTTPTCPYCRYVKDYLTREKISFVEKNVASDRQAAMEMIKRSGQQGVPVTDIAGEAIVGFNQPALRAAVTRLRQQGAGNSGIKLGAQVADAAKVLPGQGKPSTQGALLGEIKAGSLAEKSGLKVGDIIVALAGQAVEGVEDLAKELQRVAISHFQEPTLNVWRNGREEVLYLAVE
jgi:glutaredoxin-like YruB-family protein